MTPRHLLEPGRLAGAALLKAQSDTRLVDLTRAGNDRAFEAIVERYNAQLLRYCSRILPDGRGEDAVQQTFLKAYDAIHRDTTPLSLRGWLFGIAHNVSLNVLRQRGSDHEPLEAHDQAAETADATIERRERFREVLAAVAALPPGQRDALLLRELEGRGHEEIARELGVSGGAARQLISRARNGIRAAAAAVMPLPFVMRLTEGSDAGPPTAERLAELTALGTGVTVSKVVATAAVGTTLIGGAAVTGPDLVQGERERRGADVAEAASSEEDGAATRDGDDDADDSGSGEDSSGRGGGGSDRRRGDDHSGEGTSGDGDGDEDRSGHRDSDDDDREDRSGSGDGDDDEPEETDEDNSGPGSGGDGDEPDEPDDGDNSGSGSGDDTSGGDGGDSSGPGSGGDSDAPDLVEPDDDVIETDSVDEDSSGSSGGSD